MNKTFLNGPSLFVFSRKVRGKIKGQEYSWVGRVVTRSPPGETPRLYGRRDAYRYSAPGLYGYAELTGSW